MNSSNQMKRGDYVSITDPKFPHEDGHMPTVHRFVAGTVFKIHNDGVYVTIVLPNGVKQKIPRGRCKVLKDEKEYFKYLLGAMYQ